MKHFIYVFILSILLPGISSAQQSNYTYIEDCDMFTPAYGYTHHSITDQLFQWQYFQTPVSNQITDVMFKSGLISWYGWATHTGMGLVMTKDAGNNWITISFNDTTFTTSYRGVYFIDYLTGWAVGGAMQIRKTIDGGYNWTRQIPPPIAGVLNSVYFFDANTGLAVGRKNAAFNSCILRTTNGGDNWYEIIASTANQNELHDQCWLNANEGWICGRSILLKSTNGGVNFTNYYANVPPTSNGVNVLLSIDFAWGSGWIGGSNIDHKNIYKTTNNGLNWVFQNNPVAQYTYTQINDIEFSDNNLGWAAHGTPGSGAIMITSNGGANWEIEEGTNVWFDCLYILNDFIVYSGSGGGKVWYRPIPSSINRIESEIPDKFALYQNYPNPFNPVANIRFKIPENAFVSIKIYNILGKEIATLVNETINAGVYETQWKAGDYPGGVYFYRIEVHSDRITTGYITDVKKMLLIK